MSVLTQFALQLSALGPWALLLFVLAYIVATIAFVPGAVLTLVAGAVFGFWRGVAIVFVGAVLGSSVAFGLARWLARHHVAHWLERDPRMARVSRAVAGRGLLVVLLLRLSPVIPYNVVNYALGLSQVRYREFLIGSIGMLPGTLFYTYSGKVVGDVAKLAAGAAPPRGTMYYVLLGLGLIATGGVMLVLTRTARRALGNEHENGVGSHFSGDTRSEK